jgi:hypothetical protein
MPGVPHRISIIKNRQHGENPNIEMITARSLGILLFSGFGLF